MSRMSSWGISCIRWRTSHVGVIEVVSRSFICSKGILVRRGRMNGRALTRSGMNMLSLAQLLLWSEVGIGDGNWVDGDSVSVPVSVTLVCCSVDFLMLTHQHYSSTVPWTSKSLVSAQPYSGWSVCTIPHSCYSAISLPHCCYFHWYILSCYNYFHMRWTLTPHQQNALGLSWYFLDRNLFL